MGVIPIRIPLSPVWTGIQMLVAMPTPAKSTELNFPDMFVSKKVMADKASCVTRMGMRMIANCFSFPRVVLVGCIVICLSFVEVL